jgi:uncharacterized membrane protein YhhN
MAVFRLEDRFLKPAVLTATGLFLCMAAIFFLPIDIPHKVSFPLIILSVAGLWLLPWQMLLAMIFSAAGDYMGSCGNFIGQMGFFALAHVWLITFFISRYRRKVERDGKLTTKTKGYLAIMTFCVGALLVFALTNITSHAPEGVIRIGTQIYAVLICTMLMMALLQRSSLYALGAVLFVFSDFILAWNKFVEPIPYRNYLVLGSYFLAQWLLFIRATPYRIKHPLRLMRF